MLSLFTEPRGDDLKDWLQIYQTDHVMRGIALISLLHNTSEVQERGGGGGQEERGGAGGQEEKGGAGGQEMIVSYAVTGGLTDNYPHYLLTTSPPAANCSTPARDVTTNQTLPD